MSGFLPHLCFRKEPLCSVSLRCLMIKSTAFWDTPADSGISLCVFQVCRFSAILLLRTDCGMSRRLNNDNQESDCLLQQVLLQYDWFALCVCMCVWQRQVIPAWPILMSHSYDEVNLTYFHLSDQQISHTHMLS
jgi:hypothetical protein